MNGAEIALVSVEQTCSDSACQQTELDNPGPAPDGGSSAWAFLAASCTIELMVWGVTYAYGSFQDYHEHNEDSPLYGSNTTSLSAVGTLVIGMQHLVPLLSHGVAEAYPHLLKRLTFLSLVLSALCLLIASFSESIGLVISFQGLFFGLTAGNTFTPIVIWLPQWFDRRRGLATGIIFGGSGVGGIIFPLIFNALLQHVGFHWTLRVWALLHVSITGFALFVLRPRIPPIKPHLVPKKRELLPPGPRPILNVQFALNGAIIVTQAIGWYTISLYVASIATALGLNSTTSTGVLSAFNAAAVLGYLFNGLLIDALPFTLVSAGATLICSLASFLLLGFSSSLPLILVFAIVFAMAGGGAASHMTPMSRSVAGEKGNFSLVFLYFVAVRGIAAIAGPLIASALYPDETASSSYGGSIYKRGELVGMVILVGVIMGVASLFSIVTFVYMRATKHSSL